MLICVSCNIEYNEDKKFCSYCGGPLVTKADITPIEKNMGKGEEEDSVQKLACPNCKILYEFGSSCIQCGSALVIQIPPIGKEVPETDHKKPPQNLICPGCKIIYERGNACVRCGVALVIQVSPQEAGESKLSETPGADTEPPSLSSHQGQDLGPVHHAVQGSGGVEWVKKKEIEAAPAPEVVAQEEIPQTETTEQQPTKRVTEDLERRLRLQKNRKIDYRRLSLEAGSITLMAVAGGYFLWSVYSHMITRDPNAKTPPPAEISSPVLPSPPAPTPATANVSIPQETDRREDAVGAEPMVIGKKKGL